MVANICPASYNVEEMLIIRQKKPRINEYPKDATLRKYQEEIAGLKALLQKKKQRQMRKAGQGSNGEDPDDEGETEDEDEDEDYWLEQQEKSGEREKGHHGTLFLVADEKTCLLKEERRMEDLRRESKARDKIAINVPVSSFLYLNIWRSHMKPRTGLINCPATK